MRGSQNDVSFNEAARHKRGLKASMALETAFCLPLFLFGMLTIIYLMESIRFSGNLCAALSQTAKKFSGYAYAQTFMPSSSDSALVGKAVSLTLGSSESIKYLGNTYIDESPVQGGSSGLNFFYSSMLGADQIIDLVAVYKVKPLYGFFGIDTFQVCDRAYVRAFTGYDNRKKDKFSTEEEIVYITETGTVYHKSRNCRHLRITIRETSLSQVAGERNEGGGKYYPCEHCGKSEGTGALYITSDGDRYHTKLSCSSLKRGIRAVPISKVGERRGCARCA